MPTDTPSSATAKWTTRQGQYLAFIYDYSKVNRQAPAETDIARFFGLAPPSVHRMVVELEQRGLISRVAGAARSMRVLVARSDLPKLE